MIGFYRIFWIRLLAAVLAVFVSGSLFAEGEEKSSPRISESAKAKLIKRVEKILTRKAYAYETDFHQWSEIVETHRESISAAKTEEEFAQAMRKCLNEFGISHLSFQSASSRKESRSGKLRNMVGVFMTQENGEFFVSRISESSPAYEAGIRRGDTIISIDGTLIKDRPSPIPGATSKRLKWMRGEEVFEEEIEIRDHATADPISVEWVEGDVAVIKIMSFMARYYKFSAVNKAMAEARDAKAIILDMRGNHGGFVFNFLHLAGYFTRSNEAFHMRVGRKQVGRISQANTETEMSREDLLSEGTKGRSWGLPKKKYDGPVVILVDRHSGSGGELFPASMKDLGKAVVIGTRTAGALLVSVTKRLPNGFHLSYPIYEIAPPSGTRIEGVGLEPDIVLGARETATDEIIFAKAKEVIESWN